MDPNNPASPPASNPPAADFDVDNLTAEDAKAHLDVILSDADVTKRLAAGDPLITTAIDALTRKSLRIADAPEPKNVNSRRDEPRTQSGPMPEELDGRTAMERDSAVPDDPDGYRLSYGAPISTPEDQELDSNIRTWLHAAEIPRGEADGLVDMVNRDGQRFAAMDAGQREAAASDSQQRFDKLFGADAPAALDGARRLIREIDGRHDGKLVPFLEETGLGNSLSLLCAAANAAKKKWG